jgi:hypothetical protein
MRSRVILFAIFAFIGGLPGCFAPSAYSTREQWDLDTGKKADGSTYFLDSSRNWQFAVPLYQVEVKHELQGVAPPGNKASWADYWQYHFIHLRAHQENPEKYVAFILNLRREAGLPNLPQSIVVP